MISYCKGQAGENEKAREQGIKRVREKQRRQKKKKTKQRKRGRVSEYLKEDASQEFLLIYLPIYSLCGIMERGRGGGQKERERADRRVQRCVNRQEES